MDLETVMEGLRSERGAARVELVPDDLREMMISEELTVRAVGGAMPLMNDGLSECMRRNTWICVFDDYSFMHPEGATIRMVDEHGNVVGHNLSASMIPEYSGRSDVMFISDDFVIYPDMPIVGSTYMQMLALPFRGTDDWIPEDANALQWYPATTSSEMIFRHFGQSRGKYSTAIIAMDL